ncbi:hypothetical protein LTR55_011991 [Exophiala xenobiotica]|nr:hypothetical protein LTR55_011991 [Exophiala xenobiotica]
MVSNNASSVEEQLAYTPKGLASCHLGSTDGRRLSRRHIEASRRSAREALDEDTRALYSNDTNKDDYVLDCYFTSLDYLVKALKIEGPGAYSEKSRGAIRARLQTLLDSLSTPGEVASEQAQRYRQALEETQPVRADPAKCCSCVFKTASDHFVIFFNILASALLASVVFVVDLIASPSREAAILKAE